MLCLFVMRRVVFIVCVQLSSGFRERPALHPLFIYTGLTGGKAQNARIGRKKYLVLCAVAC